MDKIDNAVIPKQSFYEDVIDFLIFFSFLYHRLADQRRQYTYIVMYTSECRTITNVNMVERGRYRGRYRFFYCDYTLQLGKIGIQITRIAIPNLTFKILEKQERERNL